MQPLQRVVCSSSSCARRSVVGRAEHLHSWGGPPCTPSKALSRCRVLPSRQQQVATADTPGQPQPPQQELARAYQQQQTQASMVQQQQQTQQQTQSRPRARSPPALRRALVPVRRTVRAGERRLGADVATVGVTVAFVAATITYDRGVEDLLDNVFGDSPTGSVACMLFGLGLVVGVRLIAGGKVRGYFSLGED